MMDQILCREKQISLLSDIFGEPHQVSPAAVFVYGHTSTGKSLVVNSIVQSSQLTHVLVNCVECYSPRFMYEHILNSLSADTESLTETSDLMKCDNMNDFVRELRQVIQEKRLENQTVYIILDKAERLRDMDVNILPAFLRLQELVNLNVSVILISEIVWEKFRFGTGFCEPFVVHFPDYSKDELIGIISSDCPEDYPDGFYNMYVNLVLSIFHYACRNLKELKHLVTLNFDKYVQPIKSGEATITDTKKLWRNIEPHLKKALQTLYLREVSSLQWEKYQRDIEASDDVTLKGLSHRSHVELPFYSKYLLIAAYLASYNPAKSDRKFFAKNSGKTVKKMATKKQERTSNHMLGPKPFPLDRLLAIFYSIVEGRVAPTANIFMQTSNHMLGPKPFPLDRLLAIFYSIVEGRVAPTANIFMQISSLISLHFLGHVSGEDQIEQPKYRCLVSLDFIKSVSRTVNFDVLRYLYDFM